MGNEQVMEMSNVPQGDSKPVGFHACTSSGIPWLNAQRSREFFDRRCKRVARRVGFAQVDTVLWVCHIYTFSFWQTWPKRV
jgi:hypothetical protein